MAIITLLITEVAKFTVSDENGTFETLTVQHVRSNHSSRETFRTVRRTRNGSESIIDHFGAIDAMNFGLRFAGWPPCWAGAPHTGRLSAGVALALMSESELDSAIDEYHDELVAY